MSSAPPTIGGTLSSSLQPAPTQPALDNLVDDPDVQPESAFQEGGSAAARRKIRHSSEKHPYASGRDQEESSSEEDSEKEDVRLVRRVGSRSKQYTDEEEKAIVRKLDIRLTLFIALLYMLSFLDRSSNKHPAIPTPLAELC